MDRQDKDTIGQTIVTLATGILLVVGKPKVSDVDDLPEEDKDRFEEMCLWAERKLVETFDGYRKPGELLSEEEYLFESILAARKVQEFLWGFVNAEWGLEEWRRMFRKRIQKIDEVDASNPHWKVEFKKRLLQNAALCIALLVLVDNKDLAEGIHPTVPSNLDKYATR